MSLTLAWAGGASGWLPAPRVGRLLVPAASRLAAACAALAAARHQPPPEQIASGNNGVYRCGFAGAQDAYEKAYHRLFDRLDWLSERLEHQRYLVGDTITEADVRLFTTLARFDAVYHGHFKCNRTKLTEMPVLWAYARDLFQTPGFGDTLDFDHIKRHYYQAHRDINPTGIVPVGPDLGNWLTPHGRTQLGGQPFGDGTPPPPPNPSETVPAEHTPLTV